MGITIQQERFRDIVPDVILLWEKHYEEIAEDKEYIALNPDYGLYLKLDDSDRLVIFTARDGDKLIGYSFFVLSYSLHYKQLKTAINDLFYLSPKYRGRMVGSRLLKEPEEVLAEKYGVHRIQMRTKTYASFGKLLERAGYDATEINYRKLVRKP